MHGQRRDMLLRATPHDAAPRCLEIRHCRCLYAAVDKFRFDTLVAAADVDAARQAPAAFLFACYAACFAMMRHASTLRVSYIRYMQAYEDISLSRHLRRKDVMLRALFSTRRLLRFTRLFGAMIRC